MPGDPVELAVTTLVCFSIFAREAAGAIVHPAFPTPSWAKGLFQLGRDCVAGRWMRDSIFAGLPHGSRRRFAPPLRMTFTTVSPVILRRERSEPRRTTGRGSCRASFEARKERAPQDDVHPHHRFRHPEARAEASLEGRRATARAAHPSRRARSAHLRMTLRDAALALLSSL
jgi:hypothetical protein